MCWLCSCGKKFVETGNREGFSEAMKHICKFKKGEIEGEHSITGLYHEDSSLFRLR